MSKPGRTGLSRLYWASLYSWRGLRAAWQCEAAFRQELLATAALVPLALWLVEDASGRALMIGSLLLVLIVELLNSAVEAVVDRFGEGLHELSGRAKDLGSAAVMLALVNVALVWTLVLLD